MIKRIHIEKLSVSAHVGVTAVEREKAQRLALNVTLWPRTATSRDEIADTVNYSEVANAVKELSGERHYKLIETLAESIAARLVERFDLLRIAVEVRKFALANAEYVSVTAVRETERPEGPASAGSRS